MLQNNILKIKADKGEIFKAEMGARHLTPIYFHKELGV